jgi:hypothetical protein
VRWPNQTYFLETSPGNIAHIKIKEPTSQLLLPCVELFFRDFAGVCPWSQPEVNNRFPDLEGAGKIRSSLYSEISNFSFKDEFTLLPYVLSPRANITGEKVKSMVDAGSLEGNPTCDSLEYYLQVCLDFFLFVTGKPYIGMYILSKGEVINPYLVLARGLIHMSSKYCNFAKRSFLSDLFLDLKGYAASDEEKNDEERSGFIWRDREELDQLSYHTLFTQTKNLLNGIFPIRLAVVDGAHRMLAVLSALHDVGFTMTPNSYVPSEIEGPHPHLYLKYLAEGAHVNFVWPSWENDSSKNNFSYNWKVRNCETIFLETSPENWVLHSTYLTFCCLLIGISGNKSLTGVLQAGTTAGLIFAS